MLGKRIDILRFYENWDFRKTNHIMDFISKTIQASLTTDSKDLIRIELSFRMQHVEIFN